MDPYNAWASEPSSSRGMPVYFDNTSPVSLDTQHKYCDDCEEALATWYCQRCKIPYCDECWRARKPHINGLPGHERLLLDGSRAEGPFETFQQLAQALDPKWTKEIREEQHRRDYSTLWFATKRSRDNSLSFEAHPRFGHLMEHHRRKSWRDSTLHPRLVSFVGGAGVGKSTLIRMLIGQLWDSTVDDEEHSDTPVPVPVVGDDSTIPTSSDVHLYHDPIGDRAMPGTPLLFADCEGFDGANQSSAARIVAEATETLTAGEHRWDMEITRWARLVVQSTMRTFKRPLSWSQSVKGHRQDALEQLFPRLLYNVSDVIVYVIAETERKKIGKVLQQLVEWSQKSGTVTVNRATLPSLIVVLNQSNPSGTNWDPEEMTARLLKENQDIMTTNVTLETHQARLESLGLDNSNLEAILKCSYQRSQ